LSRENGLRPAPSSGHASHGHLLPRAGEGELTRQDCSLSGVLWLRRNADHPGAPASPMASRRSARALRAIDKRSSAEKALPRDRRRAPATKSGEERSYRHCEERSDEAIQVASVSGLLRRFAPRNDGTFEMLKTASKVPPIDRRIAPSISWLQKFRRRLLVNGKPARIARHRQAGFGGKGRPRDRRRAPAAKSGEERSYRHCEERSDEAIQVASVSGLLRRFAPRNDGTFGCSKSVGGRAYP
jgi:hypothetical protein